MNWMIKMNSEINGCLLQYADSYMDLFLRTRDEGILDIARMRVEIAYQNGARVDPQLNRLINIYRTLSWGSFFVLLKILKDEKNELEVAIDNLTVAELIRVYLNSDESVKLGAWRKEHYSKPIILKIVTDGKSARKALADAIAKARKDLEKYSDEFKKSIKWFFKHIQNFLNNFEVFKKAVN